MANENLGNARKAKNDEFYTQYHDIEKEMNAYLEYDPDVFRDKTVLLPCDDPEWSNFTKYFAQKFQELGLRKLISTSYAPSSKPKDIPYQPTLFELDSPKFDVLSDMTQIKQKSGHSTRWTPTTSLPGAKVALPAPRTVKCSVRPTIELKATNKSIVPFWCSYYLVESITVGGAVEHKV